MLLICTEIYSWKLLGLLSKPSLLSLKQFHPLTVWRGRTHKQGQNEC